MTVRELGEYPLVARLCQRLQQAFGIDKRVLVGLGDDAAVVDIGGTRLVVTIDTQLENAHFRRRWMPPYDLGWKSVAISLSDIAAMGGKSLAVVLGLGLTGDEPVGFVDDFYNGAIALCQATNTLLLGGDTVKSPLGVMVSSAAIGLLDSEPWQRSGAQVGDALVVTGFPGEAAAGFWWLELGHQEAEGASFAAQCITRFRRPTPRVNLVPLLRAFNVRAAIDISDGLAIDAWRLAVASQVQVQIELARLPLSESLQAVARALHKDPLTLALTGGEDYELLLAVPAEEAERLCQALTEQGTPAHRIGEVTASHPNGEVLGRYPDGTLKPLEGGFQHF